MGILREPKIWAKPRPANETRRSSDLTPEEQANVRRALRFLSVRLGGWAKLAEAMGAKQATLEQAVSRHRHPSAGMAIRAARLANVAVEAILGGGWPESGRCAHCNRFQ
jgi:hypothetical protein